MPDQVKLEIVLSDSPEAVERERLAGQAAQREQLAQNAPASSAAAPRPASVIPPAMREPQPVEKRAPYLTAPASLTKSAAAPQSLTAAEQAELDKRYGKGMASLLAGQGVIGPAAAPKSVVPPPVAPASVIPPAP